MSLTGLLGSWQFWVAVVLVTFVAHFVMSYLMPMLSGGGGGGS
jgi:hypothetical protein